MNKDVIRLQQLAGILKEGVETTGGKENPIEVLKKILPGVELTDDLLKNMLDYVKDNDLEGEGEEAIIQAYKNVDKKERGVMSESIMGTAAVILAAVGINVGAKYVSSAIQNKILSNKRKGGNQELNPADQNSWRKIVDRVKEYEGIKLYNPKKKNSFSFLDDVFYDKDGYVIYNPKHPELSKLFTDAQTEKKKKEREEWEKEDAKYKWVKCSKCDGRGVLGRDNHECSKCDGQGEHTIYTG